MVDFHALRMTFITNLSRAGVSPKTAQLLARHCDINLTMNTYTTLGVMDQAAAVESLPPIPSGMPQPEAQRALATGTDGAFGQDDHPKKVPTVVPSGAEIGAKGPASSRLRIAPDCSETTNRERNETTSENAKTSGETGGVRAASHAIASPHISGQSGDRTRTGITPHGILSPERLPIPPSGLEIASAPLYRIARSTMCQPRPAPAATKSQAKRNSDSNSPSAGCN